MEKKKKKLGAKVTISGKKNLTKIKRKKKKEGDFGRLLSLTLEKYQRGRFKERAESIEDDSS